MTTTTEGPSKHEGLRPQHWACLAIFILLCVGFMVLPVYHSNQLEGDKDYSLWYHIGHTIRAGGFLYPQVLGARLAYMYPPFPAAAIYAPLSVLSYPAFIIALGGLSCLAWAAAILMSAWLASGQFWARPLLYVIPTALVLPYAWDIFVLGQINMILLALTFGGLLALGFRRQILAGSLIGIAAAIKLFPILAVPYLLYRRYWGAAGVAIVMAVCLEIFVPPIVQGANHSRTDLYWWAQNMLLPAPLRPPQRQDMAFTYNNQSLLGWTHRLLRPVPAATIKGQDFYMNVASLTPPQAQATFYGLAILLSAGFALMLPRQSRRTRLTDSYEWPMLLILIVLFSPLAFGYFFCWLLPGFARAVAFVVEPDRSRREKRIGLAGISAAVVVLLLTLGQVLGPLRVLSALGTTLFGSLLLFFTLGWMLMQSRITQRGIIACSVPRDGSILRT